MYFIWYKKTSSRRDSLNIRWTANHNINSTCLQLLLKMHQTVIQLLLLIFFCEIELYRGGWLSLNLQYFNFTHVHISAAACVGKQSICACCSWNRKVFSVFPSGLSPETIRGIHIIPSSSNPEQSDSLYSNINKTYNSITRNTRCNLPLILTESRLKPQYTATSLYLLGSAEQPSFILGQNNNRSPVTFRVHCQVSQCCSLPSESASNRRPYTRRSKSIISHRVSYK